MCPIRLRLYRIFKKKIAARFARRLFLLFGPDFIALNVSQHEEFPKQFDARFTRKLFVLICPSIVDRNFVYLPKIICRPNNVQGAPFPSRASHAKLLPHGSAGRGPI